MAKKLRIDKILSNLGYGSRAELKVYCKKGMVKVNDKVISNPGTQVDTDVDKIDKLAEVNDRYKNYIPFNKSVITNKKALKAMPPTILIILIIIF